MIVGCEALINIADLENAVRIFDYIFHPAVFIDLRIIEVPDEHSATVLNLS
jgi:hypothetical protein